MIKVKDFGASIAINGDAEQIAVEFECLAKQIRIGFCGMLGDEGGNSLYEEILANAKKTDAEREKECSEIIRNHPEFAEQFLHSQAYKHFQECFGAERDSHNDGGI